MSDLWQTGAEPVDLIAARLLWKSPWWAKVLESKDEVSVTEQDFIKIVGRLYRDFTRLEKRKPTRQEFADLASMARKVRWKQVGGFGSAHLGLMRKKLGFLEWNPERARFDVSKSQSGGSSVCPPRPDRPWKELSKRAKIRQGAKIRRWEKEHKEERQADRISREMKISGMVKDALKS